MAGNAQAITELVESELENQRGALSVVSEIKVLPFDDMHFEGLPTSSFSYRFVKRSFDIAVSGALLLILSPLFLLIMLAVRVSSPGPVFYRERRVGRFGKHFTIYKFRSMFTRAYLRKVLNYRANEHAHMQLRMEKKRARDPRITRVGALLRRLSLDELPQLINILKGDMSLVGPRPVIDAELSHYGDHALFYNMMYPGLSGLWQVSGRSDVSYPARISMDVAYCQKWSLVLDMVILARTLPAVFQGTGAY